MRRANFAEKVIKVVSGIPRGETMTYKEVAKRAGNSRAARAVGNILNRHYRDCIRAGKKTIACYRVVRSDGEIGGYVRGKREKKILLQKEIRPGRIL